MFGLGNPGRRYAHTRHNAGFLVIDRLAERWGGGVPTSRYDTEIDKVRIGSASAVLCKPQTFMNLSGQAVASLKGFFKVDNDSILVIHDEVDLPFGEVRTKAGGGHRGHNGLRDISKRVGSDYHRIRVGVGRPPSGWDTADHVLAKFSAEESNHLDALLDDAANAVEEWIH